LKHKIKKQELLSLGKKYWIQLRDVEKIICKKNQLTKEEFFLLDEIDISDNSLHELKALLRKVSFGYPLEYILESAEFYGLDFYVDKRCLIPRDDTEIMVDEAIKTLEKLTHSIYIDVWTWSWAISVAIVDNISKNIAKGFAVDISTKALEIAKINIKKYSLENKIELLKSDLLNKINFSTEGFSPLNYIITANLPYIKDEDYWNMDKEVILHEPAVALYWWKKTGFELYEKLITQIFEIKKNNIKKIILFIEIWFDQKEVAIAFLEKYNLDYRVFRDSWWVDRCIKVMF